MRNYIESIVEKYVGKGSKRGSELILKCPFHKGGQERKPSFYVNLEKGLFNCFACHASGNISRLLFMLGVSHEQIDREIEPIKESLEENRKIEGLKRKGQLREDPFVADPILKESVIAPFFYCPMDLVDSGFSPEWLYYKQIGFDQKKQRITFPIRDMYGNLAGVSGRSTSPLDEPKYKVYRGGYTTESGEVVVGDFGEGFDEEYPNYKFKNHEYLWNFDLVYPRLFWGEDSPIIIVEGFKACLWLLQHGFWNTVALMGSSLGYKQLQQLQRVGSDVILMLDNDNAGIEGANKAKSKLLRAGKRAHIVKYPDSARQPDDLTKEQLTTTINQAKRKLTWQLPISEEELGA